MSEKLQSRRRIFYVSSENGNDMNNGFTPFEAWKTFKFVNSDFIKPGDAVLFEKGSLWREQLLCRSGVYYGSFGEGEMPKIYGSVKSDKETDWILVSEKLWKYAGTCNISVDIGLIINTDETDWGFKKFSLDDLEQNFDFYYNKENGGEVYIFADENPVKKYGCLEMGIRRTNIYFNDCSDIEIEGLCIKYTGAHGIQATLSKNVVIRDCEFAWIGGSLQMVLDGRNVRYGNAVEFWMSCKNVLVENCRINQVYDAGITHQYAWWKCQEPFRAEDSDIGMKNVTYRNNVIENCNYSFEFFLGSTNGCMENILICDNVCRNAGGWGANQRDDKNTAKHIKGSYKASNANEKAVIIRNNVFDSSVAGCIRGLKDGIFVYESNKYICKKDSILFGEAKWSEPLVLRANEEDAEQFKEIIDKNAEIIIK